MATKVPPLAGGFPAPPGLDPADVFPGSHIQASLEQSLRAWGLEAFDVFQFHFWDDAGIGRGDRMDTIQALKQERKIRLFGVSVNHLQPESALALVESGLAGTVQVIFNVFHQQPAGRLLPACRDHGTGVIVRVAGRGRADRPDHRGHDVLRG